jgi:inosine-uridine nucleoside N-ribohydrolase
MSLTRYRFLQTLTFVALLTLHPLLHSAEAAVAGKHRIPVVFHTDIGTDIDDTWALAQLLRSPELDLKLVLVDTGDTQYRAKIVAKLLEIAGRTDVVIGLGVSGPMPEQEHNQAAWVKGYDLTKFPGKVVDDGIGALITTVMQSPEPITIISVGAVPGLAAALKREPSIAPKARFVGMHGSFDVGYGGGKPSAESNVKLDPAALRTVLAAHWQDALLTPLDTCGNVRLAGENYHAIWCATSDPLLRGVIEGYCVFAPHVTWMNCDFFATRSTTLFDCVAVYLAYSEELVETESLLCKVTDDGFTIRDPEGSPVRVAIRWKSREAFETQLTTRLQKKS